MADKTYRLSFGMSDGTTKSVEFTVPQPEAIDIPAYWQSALDAGVKQINTAMLEAGHQKSAFLFYSDAHWTYNSKMSPKLLKYLYQHTPMTKTFFGGDIVHAEVDDYDTMAYLWEWRNMLKGLPNHHSVPGNHDDGNTTNNLFSEQYVYGYLLGAEETPDVVRTDAGLYYYIDNAAEKTRYLFLDTAFQMVIYDAKQAQFIVDALTQTPEGWHIITVAHIWYNTASNETVGELSYNGTLLANLFDAYNARGVGTLNISNSSTDSTKTPVDYDFSACGGTVEFCIGGHTHWDYDGVSDGGIPIINVETDSVLVRSGLDHTIGTANEASVNGIIANYEAREITIVRVGRGESRTIPLKAIPAAYTNVLRIATDKDGSLYNDGAGYKDNARYSSSSNADTTATGWDVTGYIPAKRGDIIRLQNVDFIDLAGTGGNTPRSTVYAFDSAYGYITAGVAFKPDVAPSDVWGVVYGDDGDIVQFTVPMSWSASVAFIRFGAIDINENSIITVNEEIV